MSDTFEPRPSESQAEPPYVLPARPPAASTSSGWRAILVLMLGGSIAINILLVLILWSMGSFAAAGSTTLTERYHSGTATAANKVAVIHIDGVLLDGLMDYANKQIEMAAADEQVKAVVLRINSPGGSITASDDLHRRIVELRDGKHQKQRGGKKPLVASMGGVAASGGYYIAVPAQEILAEVTTMTGSIGVYAAFPNVKKLGDEIGFSMNIIKAGDVKASGSLFHEMKPEERQLWQDLVDNAYDRFLEVVESGRPDLKGKLKEVIVNKEIEVKDDTGNVKLGSDGKPLTARYIRRRADGGIFTAQDALRFQLIDEIGYLETAIANAAKRAGLADYRAVHYERPPTLASILFGQAPPPAAQLDTSKLANAATPRLWYLTPQAELSGILATLGRP